MLVFEISKQSPDMNYMNSNKVTGPKNLLEMKATCTHPPAGYLVNQIQPLLPLYPDTTKYHHLSSFCFLDTT